MNGLDLNDSGRSPRAGTDVFRVVRSDPAARQKDLTAAGIIFLYCLLFAVLRLAVSSSMELDESEQFLNGSFFSLGYAHQPPLYSWMVHSMSLLLGMNLQTLIITKYVILFFFYLSFYRIARFFWDSRGSLLITGSLLFFPTYSYEFNRDLSHSVLVTAMASITCYLFIRLLQRKRTIDYLLFGTSIGLGLLSKYNFAFFLSALILAAASFNEGRRMLSDKKVVLSLAGCLLIISPHVVWLIQSNFLPFRHALTKAEAGTLSLSAAGKALSVIVSSYSGVAIFLVIFAVFFGSRISRGAQKSQAPLRLFRNLAVYGLTVTLLVIVVLRTGHFSERWLAPLLFSIPLTAFSKINLESDKTRVNVLGYLCIFIAVSILLVRSAIGFFPDAAGKVERIHTPFKDISLQLRKELGKRDIDNLQDLTIITESEFLAANMMYHLPDAKIFLSDGDPRRATGIIRTKAKVILWDAGKQGDNIPDEFIFEFPSALPLRTLTAPYLHSTKFPPYVLGVALIQ